MNGGVPSGTALPKLVLAGARGRQAERLSRQAAELDLTQQVVLTGYVAQPDLSALLSGALCLAFPSLYEGFGFPVLEAMACGTPVICSNTSSLPEVAGDAALLVDPADTGAWAEGLTRLMGDTSLRECLVQRGFHQIQTFSWERAAAQVLQVFGEVLDA
jgi:glycosyltransferase involved in cell wall biosynthesis